MLEVLASGLILLRPLGFLLLVLCTTGVGIVLAGGLTERVKALELAEAVLDGLTAELSYSLAPLDEAVGRLVRRETLSKAAYLELCGRKCAEEELPFPMAWRAAVTESPGALDKEDAEVLEALADTLGQSDLGEQLVAIDRSRALLKARLEEARTEAGNRGKLYRTMGMLTGVFLVILWI